MVDDIYEDSLTWSFMDDADREEVEELCQAIDYLDGALATHECPTTWDDPTCSYAIVGRDPRGMLAAYGWAHICNVLDARIDVMLDGGVHPSFRHRGIGRRVLDWSIRAGISMARSANKPRLRCCAVVDANRTIDRHTLERVGLLPSRWYCDMIHDFAGIDYHPEPERIPGVKFRPYDEQLSEPTRALWNQAIAADPEAGEVSKEDWAASWRRPEARAEWSWVAFAGYELIGCALNSLVQPSDSDNGIGWTDRIAVLPEWREKGIEAALLSWSMKSFGRAGLDGAGLGVDTPDLEWAKRSFTAVGYESSDVLVQHSRTIAV